MLYNIFCKLLLAAIMITFSSVAISNDQLNPDWKEWQWHGFFSQSYIKTDDNNFFGDSESGSFEFFEAGISTRWQAWQNLSFSVQALSRDAGAFDNGRLRIDYGFLDWQARNSDTYRLGFRVGRTLHPLGLFNETRDVAATRPSIFLPQSIYHDANRNLVISSDGGQIYQDWFTEESTISLNVSLVYPRLEDPGLEEQLFHDRASGNLTQSAGWLARLTYDYDFNRIRLGLTLGDIRMKFKGESSNIPIENGRFTNRPLMLSAQYNGEKLEVTGEVNFSNSAFSQFDSTPWLNRESHGLDYYLQSSYSLSDKWRTFIRYDVNARDKDDLRGIDLARLTGEPSHSFFANDLTLGLRWDLDDHWMFSTEIHSIEGTLFLSDLENGPVNERSKNWYLCSALASFRF